MSRLRAPGSAPDLLFDFDAVRKRAGEVAGLASRAGLFRVEHGWTTSNERLGIDEIAARVLACSAPAEESHVVWELSREHPHEWFDGRLVAQLVKEASDRSTLGET